MCFNMRPLFLIISLSISLSLSLSLSLSIFLFVSLPLFRSQLALVSTGWISLSMNSTSALSGMNAPLFGYDTMRSCLVIFDMFCLYSIIYLYLNSSVYLSVCLLSRFTLALLCFSTAHHLLHYCTPSPSLLHAICFIFSIKSRTRHKIVLLARFLFIDTLTSCSISLSSSRVIFSSHLINTFPPPFSRLQPSSFLTLSHLLLSYYHFSSTLSSPLFLFLSFHFLFPFPFPFLPSPNHTTSNIFSAQGIGLVRSGPTRKALGSLFGEGRPKGQQGAVKGVGARAQNKQMPIPYPA